MDHSDFPLHCVFRDIKSPPWIKYFWGIHFPPSNKRKIAQNKNLKQKLFGPNPPAHLCWATLYWHNTGDLILSNLERPGGRAGLQHQLGECQQGSGVGRRAGRQAGRGRNNLDQFSLVANRAKKHCIVWYYNRALIGRLLTATSRVIRRQKIFDEAKPHLQRYSSINFVVSVLPAPDSPEITRLWLTWLICKFL